MLSDADLNNIIEEQYYLSKYAHISYTESTLMSDWERTMLLNFIIRDNKEEQNSYENI